jgi:glycosyltransferase involved in cell wall biosynthesis
MRFSFFVNQLHTFSDGDYESMGVGGSEGSIILLTRDLAKQGHSVEIFSRNPKSGNFSGVTYKRIEDLNLEELFDVTILFRATFYGFAGIRAKRRIFWSTDLDWADWDRWVFPFSDHVLCMSPFHRDFLLRTYSNLQPEKVIIVGLGIDESEYIPNKLTNDGAKKGNHTIFCSVPNRGLEFLPKIFREIQCEIPDVTLHITSDYSLWGRDPGTETFRAEFMGMNGVFYHGKISRSELVLLQMGSKLMLYPCVYPEGFCIAALECIAAGAVPICTDDFALQTTVSSSGVLIFGQPGTEEYDRAFVAAAVRLLRNENERMALCKRGEEILLKDRTWNAIAKCLVELCS